MLTRFTVVVLALLGLGVTGCSQADTISKNISTAADNFEIARRVVFYNGITSDYILVIEGLCSLGNYDSAGELTVTCKVGAGSYKKHFLGLSDNVTFFAEQIDPVSADPYHYRVIFRPSTIIPSMKIQ